jgi:hypothetical protein
LKFRSLEVYSYRHSATHDRSSRVPDGLCGSGGGAARLTDSSDPQVRRSTGRTTATATPTTRAIPTVLARAEPPSIPIRRAASVTMSISGTCPQRSRTAFFRAPQVARLRLGVQRGQLDGAALAVGDLQPVQVGQRVVEGRELGAHLRTQAGRERFRVKGFVQPSDAERLLLVAYAYGTNTGISAVAAGNHGHSEADLRYTAQRYFTVPAPGPRSEADPRSRHEQMPTPRCRVGCRGERTGWPPFSGIRRPVWRRAVRGDAPRGESVALYCGIRSNCPGKMTSGSVSRLRLASKIVRKRPGSPYH